MLDVHILLHPATSAEWQAQCMNSVREAADNAGFPVEVHAVPAFLGHIGRARAVGYAVGSHPFVTSVDDDDWVTPEAFAVLAKSFEHHPAAIFTLETCWQNGKPLRFEERHHLAVYRRDVVQAFDFEPWRAFENVMLMRHAEACGLTLDIPKRVYNHRLYAGSHARALRRANPEEARRVYG